ncbi:type II toxin-antitoxin system Phd/YefM family antitoxin [Actinoplanes sp. NPDC051346]|uniref:type II toxin-antitoxin system Phd/YefM family antitoxin n=1 Tax=Actinoplanes sp. NPDC051346 TaxID=3155048 RepID=UPI003446DABF
MAQPSPTRQPSTELPINDVRTRLTALARMTNLTGAVTVITEGGHPIAALVPADTARSRSEAQAAQARQQAAARGWQQRLDTMRQELRLQHQQRADDLQRALQEAWALIDQLCPADRHRRLDQLRVLHRALWAEGEQSGSA